MNISIQTTAERMIVRDLDKGTVLEWADVVMVQYGASERRTILFLGTYEDSTIKIVSAPPAPAPAAAAAAVPAAGK